MHTDLHMAAIKGEIEPFKKIANARLRSLVTLGNNTVVHLNIVYQNTEGERASAAFVEWILDRCPSLLVQVNAKGDAPLHVAARLGLPSIVEFLIEFAKQRIKEVESGVKTVRQMLGMINDVKDTALHEAVRSRPGRVDIVRKLIEADPDVPYSANVHGETPLYMAAASGSSEMVLIMLENCPSTAHEGPNGKNALHAAVNHHTTGFLDFVSTAIVIDQLLKKKKSLSRERDQHGWTPLHHAVYSDKNLIAIMLLISDPSTASIVDGDRKMTALHLAASQGKEWLVREIIRQCPECYDMVDNRRWNVLHFAMVSMKSIELKSLLDEFPILINLINEKDVKGNTPLHVLATVRRDSISQYLPSNVEADYDAVNNQNLTVARIIDYGYPDIEKEIQELCKDVGSGGQYFKGVLSVRGPDPVVEPQKKDVDDESQKKDDTTEHDKKIRPSSLLVLALLLVAMAAFAALMKYSFH